MNEDRIVAIRAREVLAGIPEPTIEVEVTTGGGATGIASVPRGASRGAHEVVDLRDGGARYGGQGVLRAIEQVRAVIAPALVGMDVCAQRRIDAKLRRGVFAITDPPQIRNLKSEVTNPESSINPGN